MPQEEHKASEEYLLKQNPKSKDPCKWQKITELMYGDYHPYIFTTSNTTDAQDKTILFQAKGFLVESVL